MKSCFVYFAHNCPFSCHFGISPLFIQSGYKYQIIYKYGNHKRLIAKEGYRDREKLDHKENPVSGLLFIFYGKIVKIWKAKMKIKAEMDRFPNILISLALIFTSKKKS